MLTDGIWLKLGVEICRGKCGFDGKVFEEAVLSFSPVIQNRRAQTFMGPLWAFPSSFRIAQPLQSLRCLDHVHLTCPPQRAHREVSGRQQRDTCVISSFPSVFIHTLVKWGSCALKCPGRQVIKKPHPNCNQSFSDAVGCLLTELFPWEFLMRYILWSVYAFLPENL